MGIGDYFRKVRTASAAELDTFLRTHTAGEYNLVDVRSRAEYERGHLPGARLIPLSELPQRHAELDATKPTFAY